MSTAPTPPESPSLESQLDLHVGDGGFILGTAEGQLVRVSPGETSQGVAVASWSGLEIDYLLLPLVMRGAVDQGAADRPWLIVDPTAGVLARSLAPLCAAIGRPCLVVDPWDPATDWGTNPLGVTDEADLPLLASVLLSVPTPPQTTGDGGPQPLVPHSPDVSSFLALMLQAARSGALDPWSGRTLPGVARLVAGIAQGETGPLEAAFRSANRTPLLDAGSQRVLRGIFADMATRLAWLTDPTIAAYFGEALRRQVDVLGVLGEGGTVPARVVLVAHPRHIGEGSLSLASFFAQWALAQGALARQVQRTGVARGLVAVLAPLPALRIPEIHRYAGQSRAYRLSLVCQYSPMALTIVHGAHARTLEANLLHHVLFSDSDPEWPDPYVRSGLTEGGDDERAFRAALRMGPASDWRTAVVTGPAVTSTLYARWGAVQLATVPEVGVGPERAAAHDLLSSPDALLRGLGLGLLSGGRVDHLTPQGALDGGALVALLGSRSPVLRSLGLRLSALGCADPVTGGGLRNTVHPMGAS